MKRLPAIGCVVMAVFFGFLVSSFAYLACAAEGEIARYEQELAAVKKEFEAAKKAVLDDPAIAGLGKEITSLDASLKEKNKALTDLLDQKMNKDATYVALTAKAKEADLVAAEIKKLRTLADEDPGVKALQKEAAELRAQLQAKETAAKKAADERFNADPKVKELIARREAAAKSAKEAADFKNKIFAEPEVKTLQTDLGSMKKTLAAKSGELRKMTEAKIKSDARVQELDAKIKDLSTKIREIKKGVPAAAQGAARKGAPAAAQPPAAAAAGEAGDLAQKMAQLMGGKGGMPPAQGAPEGTGAPTPQGAGAKEEAAPAKKEGFFDKIAGAKSGFELKKLVAAYEKQKQELEAVVGKIAGALAKLAPDSDVYQKTKKDLAGIGAPKLDASLFK